MKDCSKFKESTKPHHYNPEANCQNCAYFSKANCQKHVEPADSGSFAL